MLSDITIKPTDTGMGGLHRVEVIEAAGLEPIITRPINDGLGQSLGPGWEVVESGLTLRSGHRWAAIYSTFGKSGYSEPTEETDNGPLTQVSIRLFVPGDVTLNRAAVRSLFRRPLIVRCEDNHGVRRLVGTHQQPIYLTRAEYDTQLEAQGLRGTLILFSGQLTSPVPALV